ncbi:hypothetical protein Tco_0796933 [Tanacetum coccineum]
MGKVAYKLELPTIARIHSVFHISKLKKMKNPSITHQEIPAGLTEDMELILDLPTYEATSELYSIIEKQFPDFHLEDKVAIWEGSIDKTWFRETYQMRPRNKWRG